MPRIRVPARAELETLRSLEREAGRAFRAIGMPEIAGDEPAAIAELEAFRVSGRAWVAVTEGDEPVAYLLSTIVDGSAHIERPALTLTTFRDVPWNAPYYRRLGFAVLEPADQGPQLAALVAHEATAIPGDAPRVAMRRPVGPA